VDSLAASKLLGQRKPRVITSGAISQFCRAQLAGVEVAGGGETGAKGERGTLGPHGVTAV
jgi:hypothetical protein